MKKFKVMEGIKEVFRCFTEFIEKPAHFFCGVNCINMWILPTSKGHCVFDYTFFYLRCYIWVLGRQES